jgi:small subunit ribosomal protein S16
VYKPRRIVRYANNVRSAFGRQARVNLQVEPPMCLEEHDMVVIRLSRGGAKKRPFFNIIATDSRSRRDGAFIERVGFYNPVAAEGEEGLRIAMDRVTYWTGNGAQLSPTVARLVKDFASKNAQPAA